MCGIMGASGRIDPKIIVSLGCQLESRGDDSSGIAWIDGDKKTIHLEKVAQSATVAFPLTLRRAIQLSSHGLGMIGHTRQATAGAVNAQNAHPFLMDGIAFAHNGMIFNSEKFGKYEVDSQSLIHGIKSRDFSKYVGSIALVWLEGSRLYAYRKGNPLFRGRKAGALYLASERGMLGKVGCVDLKELTEGHLYTIGKGVIVSTKKIPVNRVAWYYEPPEHRPQYDYWKGDGRSYARPADDRKWLSKWRGGKGAVQLGYDLLADQDANALDLEWVNELKAME